MNSDTEKSFNANRKLVSLPCTCVHTQFMTKNSPGVLLVVERLHRNPCTSDFCTRVTRTDMVMIHY